jgi:hypothetical protein
MTSKTQINSARHERGSVLVIAMLIILAMTGVGAVAFTSAITATRAASSFSTGKQAALVAQMAVLGGIEELACTHPIRLASLRGGRVTDWHSSDTLCGGDSAYFDTDPFGRREARPEFLVTYTEATLGRRAFGFDTAACYFRVRVEAEGELEMDPIGDRVGSDQTQPRLTRRRAVGYVYVGPVVDGLLCGE